MTIALLLVLPTLAAAADEVTRAREAIAAKQFVEAREIYLRLAEQEPRNPEYLIWIGRLSGWLEEFDRALEAFDHALALDPQNPEALAGKGAVLTWQGKYDEAEPFLLAAEAEAPADLDIQLSLARNDFYRGRKRSAEQRVWRVLAKDSTNPDARALLLRLSEPSRTLQAKFGLQREDFSRAGDSATMGMAIVDIAGERDRLTLQFERWDKFDEQVNRGGAGLTRRIGPWFVHASGLWAPDAEVLPRQELNASVARRWRNLVTEAAFRHLRFSSAEVLIVTPALDYVVSERGSIRVGASKSFTEFDQNPEEAENESFLARVLYRPAEGIGIQLGYATGSESFATISAERLGRLDADTWSVGLEVELSDLYLISGSFADQSGSGVDQQIYNLLLTIRP